MQRADGWDFQAVKIAERNRAAALEILALADIEVLQVAEVPAAGERGGRR